MSSPQLTGWLAFEAEYGLPDGYFVAGLICSTIAGIFNSDMGPEDFVPYLAAGRPPRRENTDEENLERGRQLAARFGGFADGIA